MAITSVDEGKRQVDVSVLVDILKSQQQNKIIVLNALKVISNCAVFPPSRRIFSSDEDFITKLQVLKYSKKIFYYVFCLSKNTFIYNEILLCN